MLTYSFLTTHHNNITFERTYCSSRRNSVDGYAK